MLKSQELQEARTSALKAGLRRTLLPNGIRNLMGHRWFRASPIFFVGTVITAVGTTIYQSDTVIFVGMGIMGLGVVAMWVAEAGNPGLKSFPGPVAFVLGSIITAMSMTINPSNPLLCGGMILTGLGTIAMWVVLVGEWGTSTAIVAVLFSAGVATEALGMTVVPSDLMIMVGMIVTGIGVFAMWAYEASKEAEEEKEKSEEKALVSESRE